MLSPCRCTPEAERELRALFGIPESETLGGVEAEFREVPYFLVSRSRQQWSPEKADINELLLIGADERGIYVDPDSAGRRMTLVPWPNVVSLTLATGEVSPGKGQAPE